MPPVQVEARNHKNSDIAFILVVVAAYVVYFMGGGISDPLWKILTLIGMGSIFLVVGLYGSPFVEVRHQAPLTLAFFVIEIGLGAAITYISNGAAWLVLVPIAGSAVELLSRPWAIITCAAILAGMTVPFFLLYGGEAAFMWGMTSLAALVFVAAFTQITVSEHKARTELAHANQKLREYASQIEELAIVQERNRLAREIHDGLGHYLTAIHIQIKAAEATAQQDSDLSLAALKNAQTLTQEALADVRRSISSLRSDPSTSRPLPETLSRLLADTEAAGIQTRFTVSGEPHPLPSQIEFALYRTVQEGLTNVRKHAQARCVDLTLTYLDHAVRLSIHDDGIGAEQTAGGFGLLGLKERCELLGGALQLSTAPGAGFTLQMEIPT